MSRKRAPLKMDDELEAAVQSAVDAGIPLSTICRHAEVDQSTLWKWRTGRSSPTMSTRQAVLDAIKQLVQGAS